MKTARQTQLLILVSATALSACTGNLDGSTPGGDGPGSLFITPARALCGPDCAKPSGSWHGNLPTPCFEGDCLTYADPDGGAPIPMMMDDGGVPMAEPPPEPEPVEEPPVAECVRARRLWHEDFETGNYDRWTGRTYDNGWGNHCQGNRFDSTIVGSGSRSHRSEIVCRSHDSVHRGYGGLQFEGERVLPGFTNRGAGLEAPEGVVNTFWTYLDTPYEFGSGRWFSVWTVNSACDYSERVVTLGLEDATRRLTPAHITETGGRVTWSPSAPAFPFRRWARITIYVNYHRGEMHVWQDGTSVFHATFRRPTTDMCQWHWGAYASGDNTNVVLYEDDISLWKLEERWTDFSREPWFEGTTSACR